MTVDLHPIRAFLDDAHTALLAKAQEFTRDVLAKRQHPETDVEALSLIHISEPTRPY